MKYEQIQESSSCPLMTVAGTSYPEVMQHLIGKTSIAWFKIADVMARGEKERTLSIYRLFAHSIRHEAVVAQLEGDILRTFNDPNAVHAYVKAAGLYQKNGEHVLAEQAHGYAKDCIKK